MFSVLRRSQQKQQRDIYCLLNVPRTEDCVLVFRRAASTMAPRLVLNRSENNSRLSACDTITLKSFPFIITVEGSINDSFISLNVAVNRKVSLVHFFRPIGRFEDIKKITGANSFLCSRIRVFPCCWVKNAHCRNKFRFMWIVEE
jgi:hypothetical protein